MDFFKSYSFVKSQVKKVLAENYIDTPPVNARELAENYGLTVKFARFPDNYKTVCGFIDFDNAVMYVNEADSAYRQNFTIAHELGHWLLHRENRDEYKVLMRRPIGGETDDREKEANVFAAELLVPKEMLKKYTKEGLSSFQLSEIFMVSESVINYRLEYCK